MQSNAQTYPIAQDLLYRLRIIKNHKSKVGQLATTVDPQLQYCSIL